MGLADDLRASQRTGSVCTVPAALATLPPEVADEIRTAFADRSIYSTTIAAHLRREYDLRLGAHTINRHRNDRCLCVQ